jgi:hypothetical protein
VVILDKMARGNKPYFLNNAKIKPQINDHYLIGILFAGSSLSLYSDSEDISD